MMSSKANGKMKGVTRDKRKLAIELRLHLTPHFRAFLQSTVKTKDLPHRQLHGQV